MPRFQKPDRLYEFGNDGTRRVSISPDTSGASVFLPEPVAFEVGARVPSADAMVVDLCSFGSLLVGSVSEIVHVMGHYVRLRARDR